MIAGRLAGLRPVVRSPALLAGRSPKGGFAATASALRRRPALRKSPLGSIWIVQGWSPLDPRRSVTRVPSTVPLCHCATDLRVLSFWNFFFPLRRIPKVLRRL